MRTTLPGVGRRWRPFLVLPLLLRLGSPAVAQLPAPPAPDWSLFPTTPTTTLDLTAEGAGIASGQRANRIRLFRMTPGFLSDPIGLDQDDPPGADGMTTNDPGLDWVTVTMGNDNPFFDVRRPGDPGGVGYYRVTSQVQLFDSPSTGLALGLQAYTPAGLEANGVADGPTVFSPAIGVYHCLDDGTAIQGFVGKHVNLNPTTLGGSNLHRSWQYGVAVHRPLGATESDSLNNVYVFVEALGRYRYDAAPGSGAANVLEVLPGLQWKMSDNWWISGGLVLPVNGTTTIDPRLWQITCAIRY